jgi:hypothetical protein
LSETWKPSLSQGSSRSSWTVALFLGSLSSIRRRRDSRPGDIYLCLGRSTTSHWWIFWKRPYSVSSQNGSRL